MIYERNEHGRLRAIGYDAHGEGPAVLLLAPFPFDRSFWGNLALPGFRLIAIDARGYGDSALGEPGFTMDQLADDAVALLDHLGIPMAAAVGCSMGGYVALALATKRPQRLSALVLMDTRAGADGANARASRDAGIAQVRAHGAASFLDGIGVRLCGRSSSDETRAAVHAMAMGSSGELDRALLATLVALRDRPDRTQQLASLRLPTLVLVGTEDAVTPPDEARAMQRAIPGATLVELEGAGHLPSLERPAALNAALLDWLSATLLAK